MSKQEYQGNYLKGWQALLTADLLFLISLVTSTSSLIGTLANLVGFIALIIAIVVGIINLVKRKSKSPALDIAMSIVGVIILCIVMALIGGSA